MKKLNLALIFGAMTTTLSVGFGVSPVSALTFNITFDIDTSPITPVQATITTEDSVSTSSGFTGYRIISITGFQGADPIVALNAPGTTQIGAFPAPNDNLFNPNGSDNPTNPALAFFSQGGLAYTIDENGTLDQYQAFYDASSGQYMGCLTPCVTISDIQLVPEPSSTAGLVALGSFGALGIVSTLKRKN